MATTASSPGRASTVTVWAGLLVASAIAWATVLVQAGGGSMATEPAPFLGMWTAMMAAMMLPSVAPVASGYVRAVRRRGTSPVATVRVLGLLTGYLAAWAAVGVLALAATRLDDRLAATAPASVRWTVGGALLLAGVYQFTDLKALCLRNCRSPIGLLLHVGNYRGRSRDLRAGLYHSAYCIGCCWTLMLVLVAVGAMNVAWMAILAGAVFLEKAWRYGATLRLIVGVALLVTAGLVLWNPAFLGIHPAMGSAM